MSEQDLWTLAARQYGLFTRGDAVEAGLTGKHLEYRLATGRWETLFPNVFRIAGVPPSWHQTLHGSCLFHGGRAAASHRSGAAVWEYPGFPPEVVEVLVSHRDWLRLGGVRTRYTTKLPDCDLTERDGIRVTTPARTLIDLCAVAPPWRVEQALDDAERRNLVTIALLRERLDDLACRGRRGVRVMRAILDQRDPAARPPESMQERRLLRAIADVGLPAPVTQFEIFEFGRFVARVDAAYPAVRLALEYDSYRFHGGRAKFDLDLARRNALTRAGWHVVHVTAADLRDGAPVAMAVIRAALRAA
ncbi:MAG: hypothetical protein U0V73_12290 [Acidimicrobiia bacterium]